MKHLYIIGNGFDLHVGLQSSYRDFKEWLKHHYPIVFEELTKTYSADGEWWSDFENNLGELSVSKYYLEHTQIVDERFNVEWESTECPVTAAQRIYGLFDLLQYCFAKWIEHIYVNWGVKNDVLIEKNDAFFLSFNYTPTLESAPYNIPSEQILHIHGKAFKTDKDEKSTKLVMGHSRSCLDYEYKYEQETGNHAPFGKDFRDMCMALGNLQKNPEYYLYEYRELFDRIKDVEYIHIYGCSFSEIDSPYMDRLLLIPRIDKQWEISYFSEEDKNKISDFVKKYKLNELSKGNVRIIKLDDISIKKDSL